MLLFVYLREESDGESAQERQEAGLNLHQKERNNPPTSAVTKPTYCYHGNADSIGKESTACEHFTQQQTIPVTECEG